MHVFFGLWYFCVTFFWILMFLYWNIWRFCTYDIFVRRHIENPLMFVLHGRFDAAVCLVFLNVEHVTFYSRLHKDDTIVNSIPTTNICVIISISYRRFSYSLYVCIINVVGKNPWDYTEWMLHSCWWHTPECKYRHIRSSLWADKGLIATK